MLSFTRSLSQNSDALALFVSEKYEYKDSKGILSKDIKKKIDSFLRSLKGRNEKDSIRALDISDKKNLLGLKIISILMTIYLNRAYKRSLKLVKINISDEERISQDNFLKFFNIADIPTLWENISTNINLSLNFNLDKKQAMINLIDNIKKFNKNYELQ